MDVSPKLLDASLQIPIVDQVALSVVRATFFQQFVGGETVEETATVIRQLRERNIASMVDYSVEVMEESAGGIEQSAKEAPYVRNIEEMKRSIPIVAGVENERGLDDPATRKTWIAIKLTALLPSATTLRKFSSLLVAKQSEPHAPFTPDILYDSSISSYLEEGDISALKSLHSSLKEIGEFAVKHQVRICVDAEHTWYEPAIDAFATDMMRTCNRESPITPVIYQTFQAYLRSTPHRLTSALAHAKSNGYTLGVKLVRGAYHPLEVAKHESDPTKSGPPPVWSEKNETDACYNQCANMLLDQLSDRTDGKPNSSPVGILFGTHNRNSCDVIIDGIVKRGLASRVTDGVVTVPLDVSSRVQIGQLFGMADELTNYVSSRLDCPNSPMVLKCVPYGTLEDVMPYLSRRAIENKSVLGNSNTTIERQRVARELRRRLFA